ECEDKYYIPAGALCHTPETPVTMLHLAIKRIAAVKPYTVLLTDLIADESQQRLAETANVILAPDNRPETLTELAENADAIVVRSQLPPVLFERATRL